jgi:hypothetical protein
VTEPSGTPSTIARAAGIDRRRALVGTLAAWMLAAIEVPSFARMVGSAELGTRVVGVWGLVVLAALLGTVTWVMRGTWKHRGLDAAGLLDRMEARARGRLALCDVLRSAVPVVVGSLLGIELWVARGRAGVGSLVAAALVGFVTIAFGRMTVRRVTSTMIAQLSWVRASRAKLAEAAHAAGVAL